MYLKYASEDRKFQGKLNYGISFLNKIYKA